MKQTLILILGLLFVLQVKAQVKTDANIVGDVQSNGEYLPFVNIFLKGTAISTVTDETGHFKLIHMPIGEFAIVASF